eukprot:scpid26668/ scgid26501/ 
MMHVWRQWWPVLETSYFWTLLALLCSLTLPVPSSAASSAGLVTDPPLQRSLCDRNGEGRPQTNLQSSNWSSVYNAGEEQDWVDIQQLLTHTGIADHQSCRSEFECTSRGCHVTHSTAIPNALCSDIREAVHEVKALVTRMRSVLLELISMNMTVDGSAQLLRQLHSNTTDSEVKLSSLTCETTECEVWQEDVQSTLADNAYETALIAFTRTVYDIPLVCDLTICLLSKAKYNSNASVQVHRVRKDLGCETWQNSTIIQLDTQGKDCPTQTAILNSTSTSDSVFSQPSLVRLRCTLQQSIVRFKLFQRLQSIQRLVVSLQSFRQSLTEVLQPTYNFSWNISQEIALVICSMYFNDNFSVSPGFNRSSRALNSTAPNDIMVCPSHCYNTFQLLSALGTIQPQVFLDTDPLNCAWRFVQRAFSSHCLRPKRNECTRSRQQQHSSMCHHGPCMIPLPSVAKNMVTESRLSGVLVPNTYPHCSSTVYLNLSCQHPFLPVSSNVEQAEKMSWLVGKLTEAACSSLNRSDSCEVANTLLHCDVICEAVWYRDALASGLLQRWLYALMALAAIAWVSTILAVVVFFIRRHRIKSPARRAIVYMNMGMVLFLLDYFIAPFRAAAIVMNGACTADNTITTSKSAGSGACEFDGFRNNFSIIFLLAAGACGYHAWRRIVVKLTTPKILLKDEDDERLSIYYFVFAIVAASVLAGVNLATRGNEGVPSFYWCAVNLKTGFFTSTIPCIGCTVFAIASMTVSIPRLKSIMKSRKALVYHYTRRRSAVTSRGTIKQSEAASAPNSSQGLYKLLKLLSVHLLTLTVLTAAVAVYWVPLNIGEYTGDEREADSDGMRKHSVCLMTSRPGEDSCSEIRQSSIAAEIIYRVFSIYMGFFFSTWVYDWQYWKGVWPSRTKKPADRLPDRVPDRRRRRTLPEIVAAINAQATAPNTPNTEVSQVFWLIDRETSL